MHQEKILLVEDNDLVRDCLVELLSDAEMDVIAAVSGPAAVALLDEQPAALLADLRLGAGMSGRELAAVARRRCPGIAVVLMSGDAGALEHGSDGSETLLPKPFGTKELMQAIREARAGGRVANAG
jgi:CheY-like chemotaxis protein